MRIQCSRRPTLRVKVLFLLIYFPVTFYRSPLGHFLPFLPSLLRHGVAGHYSNFSRRYFVSPHDTPSCPSFLSFSSVHHTYFHTRQHRTWLPDETSFMCIPIPSMATRTEQTFPSTAIRDCMISFGLRSLFPMFAIRILAINYTSWAARTSSAMPAQRFRVAKLDTKT